FFFSSRRRHTRFKCDWSSDVCSSDLTLCSMGEFAQAQSHLADAVTAYDPSDYPAHQAISGLNPEIFALGTSSWSEWFLGYPEREIGRASCRERVSLSVGAVSV